MAQQFKIGDIVQLKSGGPTMTVVDVLTDGHIRTTWFAGRKSERGVFPADALISAPPEEQ